MSAASWACALLVYGVVTTVWLLIVLGGNADLSAENRRLRRQHLRPIHPSTRRDPR